MPPAPGDEGGVGGSNGGHEEAAARVAALLAAARRLGVPFAGDDDLEGESALRAAHALAYLDAMLAANEHVNLTGIRDPERATALHVLDGLAFGLTGLVPRDVLDLGTGNGFPGVSVAVQHPGAAVTLIDRTGKKVRAVREALAEAGLEGVAAVQMDAEQAPGLERSWRRRFDVVLSRAVGPCAKICRWAAPLLAPGGHVVLWITPETEMPERPVPTLVLDRAVDYELPAAVRAVGVPRDGGAEGAADQPGEHVVRRLAIYRAR